MNGKNYHEVKRVFVTCRAIIEECCGPRNGFILVEISISKTLYSQPSKMKRI